MVQRMWDAPMFTGFCREIEEKSGGECEALYESAHHRRGIRRQKVLLSSAAESDARQMTVASDKGDCELQADARLAFDQHLRSGARRAARPRHSGLETRSTACVPAPKVNFIRSGACQGAVRALLIKPTLEELKLALEGPAQQWKHGQHAGATLLERADEAFTNGDASRLADGAAALADGMTATPGFESGAGELRAAVRDQVFGRCSDASNGMAKELTGLLGGGLLAEHGHAQDAAGVMVHNNSNPPTKRPALRQGHWQPGRPEAATSGHRSKIDMPDVVRTFGGYAPGRGHGQAAG
jgi:hypothetical protein